jgi:hypothetical protein
MENSKSKLPSGITIDLNASPTKKSFFSSPSVESISTTPSKSSNSFSSKSKYFRIGLIIVILLFLGINIFSYLGDFLQNLKQTSAPLLKKILESLGYVVTETTKDVTNVAAKGAKLGIDVAAGTITSGVDVIQGQLDGKESSSSPPSNSNTNNNSLEPSLSSALADAEDKFDPQPDDSFSFTQRLGPGKSGFCYIGEDRGFRSCIKVNSGDTCMSGNIFPSNDICVNPNLRE